MNTIKKLALLLIIGIVAFSCTPEPIDPNAALNDTTPPTVTIIEPADAATINNSFVIKADAQDGESSVSQIKFYINGIMSGAAKAGVIGDAGVHTYTSDVVNIDNLSNGSYTIAAVAYNPKGMTSTNEITITIDKSGTYKPVVTITSPVSGNVSNTIQITATATVVNASITGVSFYNGPTLLSSSGSGPYTSSAIDTTAYANNTILTLKAIATADNGLSATNTVQVTVINPVPDTTPPSLAITSPTDGATVTGSITVGANASDAESGVASVAFSVDGTPVSTDTAAPFVSGTIDTTVLSNGVHTITAVALNGAGLGTTNSISVNVDNGNGNTELNLSLVDISDDYGTSMFGTQNIDTDTPAIKWANPVPVTGIQSYMLEVWDADEETVVWSVVNIGSSISQATYGVLPAGAATVVSPVQLDPATTYIVHVIGTDNTVTVSGSSVAIAHLFAATASSFSKSRNASLTGKGMPKAEYLKLIASMK